MEIEKIMWLYKNIFEKMDHTEKSWYFERQNITKSKHKLG